MWGRKVISAYQATTAKSNGTTLSVWEFCQTLRQSRCTHRKGGMIRSLDTVSIGDALASGDNFCYAVIKHQHMNGDVWVSCLRCGKRWKTPLKDFKWYEFRKRRAYYIALAEYKKALAFNTNNRMSSSVRVIIRDDKFNEVGTQMVRRAMVNS